MPPPDEDLMRELVDALPQPILKMLRRLCRSKKYSEAEKAYVVRACGVYNAFETGAIEKAGEVVAFGEPPVIEAAKVN